MKTHITPPLTQILTGAKESNEVTHVSPPSRTKSHQRTTTTDSRNFRPLTSSNSISYASPAQQQSRRRHHEHNQCRRLHLPGLALLSSRSKILRSGVLSHAKNNTNGTRRTWVAVRLNSPLTAMLVQRAWGIQLHAYLSPRSAGRRIGSSSPDALIDPHGYGHRCTRDDGHGHNLSLPLDERRRRRRQDLDWGSSHRPPLAPSVGISGCNRSVNTGGPTPILTSSLAISWLEPEEETLVWSGHDTSTYSNWSMFMPAIVIGWNVDD